MTVPVIIDAVVVLILVGFTVIGTRRGLLQTLTGLVIVVVALVGAGMIATTFSGPAAKLAAPLIEKRIEKKIDVAMAESAPSSPAAPISPRPRRIRCCSSRPTLRRS